MLETNDNGQRLNVTMDSDFVVSRQTATGRFGCNMCFYMLVYLP